MARSYLDFGYNSYGLKTIGQEKQMSANQVDAFFEMAEGSVRQSVIRSLAVTDTKIQSVSASKITAGIISAVTSLGDESVKLDGENRQIVINDGTDDRVLIGYDPDGF